LGDLIVELFKFRANPGNTTVVERGEMLNNITSAMWVERYREPGEFEIKAPSYSNLQTLLPPGTLISHIDTQEIMIVENIELSEDLSGVSELTITGRSFESFLENRIVGQDQGFPLTPSAPLEQLVLPAAYTWVHAATIIGRQVQTGLVIIASDALPGVKITYEVPGYVGPSEARQFPRGNVHSTILELLSIDDLGIRNVRPGTWSFYPNELTINMIIHRGVDRSASVLFSYNSGEIKNAQYLWSNKRLKTAALVTGKWVEVMSWGAFSGIEKRAMWIDGSDIDDVYATVPLGANQTAVFNSMLVRAGQVLAAHSELSISKVEIIENATTAKYRVDYNVGDVVTVVGNYDATTQMRVTEYVEILDETGSHSSPTLSAL